MLNPLNKRFKRDLKSDFGKYVAIFLFLVFFPYQPKNKQNSDRTP